MFLKGNENTNDVMKGPINQAEEFDLQFIGRTLCKNKNKEHTQEYEI